MAQILPQSENVTGADSAHAPTLLRKRGGHDSSRVSMVELFFDLVFVFAVTQLSHTLLAHLDAVGAAQIALLLVAVWWVWIYTSWVTNWLEPERIPVRMCLLALMLAGLLLSSSIPQAFAEHGFAFACAYVSMQVGRTLFFLWAVRSAPVQMRRNFQRILVWLSLSGVFWIAGGLADGSAENDTRFTLWSLALLLEFTSPLFYFRVPGLGRSSTADWDIDPHHLAERCALFVIIALGESLLVTGATFSELAWDRTTIAAFASAFFGSVAMWWIYFDTSARRASDRFAHSDDPGRVARNAYTYLHLPIVAGIIVCAVADELVLMHPDHAATRASPRSSADPRSTCSATPCSNGSPTIGARRRCRTWRACCCCSRWRRLRSRICSLHWRWVQPRRPSCCWSPGGRRWRSAVAPGRRSSHDSTDHATRGSAAFAPLRTRMCNSRSCFSSTVLGACVSRS